MEAFQLRLWDGRIGRWLSPDPYGQNYSPYMGMGNNPIGMIDPDGGYCYDSNGNTIPCGDFKEFNNSTSHMTFLNEVVVTGAPKSNNYFSFSNIQTGLDVLGSTEIPVISQLGDIGSAGMSAYQGDYSGALLSLGGAVIPGMSQAKLGLKLAKKSERLIDIYQGTKNGGKYFGQSVNLTKRYGKEEANKVGPNLLGKVPERLANAVEQQLISIHGLHKLKKGMGNGLGGNGRLQMSLKNQIKNKETMKEAMHWLDNNVDNWMGL
jgi:hypothetical protein